MKGQTVELIPVVFIVLFLLVYSPVEQNPQPILNVTGDASANWAGYVVIGEVESVEGSWIVPFVECPPIGEHAAAIWIGMDGFVSDTVEQIGTDTDCYMGIPVYYAWYEFYPKNNVKIPMELSPGDVIHASVRFENGYFNLTISDMTTNKSFSVTEEAEAKRSSAEWIAEAPLVQNGRIMNLAPFGTFRFFEARAIVDNSNGYVKDFASIPVIMRSGGVIKASPGELEEGGFSLSWHHK